MRLPGSPPPIDEPALAVAHPVVVPVAPVRQVVAEGVSPSVHVMGSLDALPSMARANVPWVASGTILAQTLPPRLRSPKTTVLPRAPRPPRVPRAEVALVSLRLAVEGVAGLEGLGCPRSQHDVVAVGRVCG